MTDTNRWNNISYAALQKFVAIAFERLEILGPGQITSLFIAMILLFVGLSLPASLGNHLAKKSKITSTTNKKRSKQYIWRVLFLGSCCLIPFRGADFNNKVKAAELFHLPPLVLFVTHLISLKAIGFDQNEPFTLDKEMEQLQSLHRGSSNQDPAGIMGQVKGFAKVREFK